MNVLPLTLSYQEFEGRIDISGEFTEALALGIEQALAKLFGYYQYERVVLRINSPGGQLMGLTHIVQCVEYWRSQGREIHTEASFQAASAAALLLVLGEVGSRTVQRYTTVLFHHTRIGGSSSAITAGSANQIASILRRTDHGLLRRVVTHVVNGLGSVKAHRDEGLTRCEVLRQHEDLLATEFDTPTVGRIPKWLTAISATYRECELKNTTVAYQRYLEKRMELDTPMDIREAYALNLIDCVHGVPQFTPRHVDSPRNGFMPALRLAV